MSKFKIGDIVKYSNPAMSGNYRVVWVYNDEPKRLLVTDVPGDTMACWHLIQCDCELVTQAEGLLDRKYTHRPDTAKELSKAVTPKEYDV